MIKSSNTESVLVLAAHPDDEVLGCGGTIAKLAAQGSEVNIHILGEGSTSRFDSRNDANLAEVENLRQAAANAAKELGAKSVTFSSLPDNRFDTIGLLDIVKELEVKIAEFRPGTVFTQHGGDLNIDHSITFRAAMTALRPITGSTTRALYAYEVNSSTEWAFGQLAPPFVPNLFVDISDHLDKKIVALNQYQNELRPFPHPRSADGVRATARHRGIAIGVAAAEAFSIIYHLG